MKLKSLFFAFTIIFFAVSSVEAANINSLEREVDAIREDLKIIQRKLYKNENSGIDDFSENAADIQVKMGEYENLIRDAIGKVDEINHKLSELEGKVELMNRDFQLRFNQLEGKKITKPLEDSKEEAKKDETGKLEKIENVIDKKEVAPADLTETVLSAEELYEKAFNILKQGKYLEAEREFELFLKTYPKNKLAGNAQYWLGESYYVRKDYARSVVAFSKGIQEYKDAAKGADSLLKLGMSLKALKQKKDACGAFLLMESQFPNAEQSLKDKAKEQAKLLECK